MFTRKNLMPVWLAAAVLLLISAAACAPAAPPTFEATPKIEIEQPPATTQVVEIEPVPTATMAPNTPTPEPTLEPTQEPSPEPTETVAPPLDQAVSAETGTEPLPEGFNAWCVRRDVYDQGTLAKDGTMPAWGRPAVMKDGKPDLIIEVQSCTFVYTFDEPVQPGTRLVIHDTLDAPFVNMELTPTEDYPNVAYAVVTHGSLVEAQVWTIDFRVAVEDPNGVEIRSEMVSFERGWRPGLCYGGMWPNAVTGRCPEMGEAHPWDPWYQYSEYGGYNEGVTTPGPIMPPPWED